MEKSMPLMSIIIPLYNKAQCIRKTIESVLSQNYENLEAIVVDDGSTDNSAAIVRNYEDKRIIYFYKANGGVSSARNYGVDRAHGEWILFLDADDYLCKDALEHFYHLICQHPNIRCFCANYYIQHKDDRKLYSHFIKSGIVRNPFKKWFFRRFSPRAGASIYHKDIVTRYRFDEGLRRYEDAEVLFNIMRSEPFVCSKHPVLVYNRDFASASMFRKNIREDFLGYLSLEGKSYWERVILVELYKQCRKGYKEECDKLYNSRDFLKFKYVVPFLWRKIILRIQKCLEGYDNY